MTMTMKHSSSLLLLLAVLQGTTVWGQEDARNLRGATVTDEVQDRELRSSLDARWKSTKLTAEEKAALGLFPPDDYVAPVTGGDVVDPVAVEGTLTVVDTIEDEVQVEQILEQDKKPPTVSVVDTTTNQVQAHAAAAAPGGIPTPKQKNRRHFLRYEPSKWEHGWMGNIQDMVDHRSICKTLLTGKHQKANVHAFLELMCSRRQNDWCYYHDHNHFMWYNTRNKDKFQVYIDRTPLVLDGVEPPPPASEVFNIKAGSELIASKFVFLDETNGEIYEEFIEPLVSQLRFPLAECIDRKPLLADLASFVIPPPSLSRVDGRTIMYDVGSTDWSNMEHIVEEWTAHDAAFQWLISYAPNGNEKEDKFLTTVPAEHQSKIFRHYFPLADAPVPKGDATTMFLPQKIQEETVENDYVMLKLDRVMNGDTKQKMVQYILDHHKNDGAGSVDELFWEINASGNYVMQRYFDANLKFNELAGALTLPDAYIMLTALRNKGIRAHAWV